MFLLKYRRMYFEYNFLLNYFDEQSNLKEMF